MFHRRANLSSVPTFVIVVSFVISERMVAAKRVFETVNSPHLRFFISVPFEISERNTNEFDNTIIESRRERTPVYLCNFAFIEFNSRTIKDDSDIKWKITIPSVFFFRPFHSRSIVFQFPFVVRSLFARLFLSRGNEGLRPFFPLFCFRQGRDFPSSKFDYHGFNGPLQIYHCSHKRDVVNTMRRKCSLHAANQILEQSRICHSCACNDILFHARPCKWLQNCANYTFRITLQLVPQLAYTLPILFIIDNG